MIKFLRPEEKVEITNLFACFWLKDKFLELKMGISVSCPESGGLWKVSRKSWLSIQPTK